MHRTVRTFIPALAVLIFLASCNSVPKHARFIPRDALAVIGVHTGEMRKSLAWSAITGSSLLEEMRKEGMDKAPEMMKDIENSGLDFGSTIYFYTKPDTRFSEEMRMGIVVPVGDAKKLAAYIQKHGPGTSIRSVKNRSEALIGGKMYLGWNDEVLIVMNTIVRKTQHSEPAKPDTLGGSAFQGEPYTWVEEIPDSLATGAEMELAFNPAKDASITDNKRFKTLESESHDISIWLAYDAMADMMGSKGGMDMMGLGMANMLWKSSSLAMGIDFDKGVIQSEMKYYSSDSMLPVMKEFAKENIDKDLLSRLPSEGLNAAIGYHLSPAALKMMLDRIGLSGMANLALMQKGLNIDDILGAFSGDMVASVNNFRIESKLQDIDSATQKEYGLTPYPVMSPKMDYVYALKVGDKTKLTKLISFLTSSEILRQTATDQYTFPNSPDGFVLVVGEKYLAASSNSAVASSFVRKTGGSMPEAVNKEIAGHVVGVWADIHSFLEAAAPAAKNSGSDSMAYNAVRNLFTTFTLNGGEFSGGANTYKMTLGFVNKEENSLVQLLHLSQQLANSKSGKKEVAVR